MKKLLILTLTITVTLSISTLSIAQDTKDNIHLFQSFHEDAIIAKTPYVDAGLSFASYDGFSTFDLGAQGGYGVNPDLEITSRLAFRSYSADGADGQSGITDLLVSGRYRLPVEGLKATAGGYITLPIGSEDIGQSHFNFGAFAALRHPLSNGMVVTGNLGLEFYETKNYTYDSNTFDLKEETEYETALRIAGGVIYPVNEQVNAIGELVIKTEGDYMMLSGGADYKLKGTGRVRGALGIGLDNGAPDFQLMISYFRPF